MFTIDTLATLTSIDRHQTSSNMKIRTFKKCLNRKKAYKHYPKYTTQIVGTGFGSSAVYWFGRMRWENGKFELRSHKVYY